jgi:hypothetical protein
MLSVSTPKAVGLTPRVSGSTPRFLGSTPKESVAVLYSPRKHYFSMIINKLQKITLQHSNKQTTNSYKQTKPTPMKTLPILKLQMMKNCILLFLLLLAGSSNAQIVNIPDANFKAKLLAADSITNLIAKDLSGYYFKIDANNDGEIQVSEALAVTSLNVENSNILNLEGIKSFINLNNFSCDRNFTLTTLDVSGLTNLTELYCNNLGVDFQFPIDGHISSINVNGCLNLKKLVCPNNLLTSLDLSGLTNFEYLFCYKNQIANLNLSGASSLNYLNCDSNHLTTLDLSSASNLSFFNCSSNQLTSLFIKNGSWDGFNNFGTPSNIGINPNLQYICADEFEISLVSQFLNQFSEINSYCTFNPGGTYNTITGSQLFDSNSNGCDINDAPFPNIKIKINDGTTTGATFTNATGNYNFYTQAGSFTVAPEVENPSFFNFSPATAVVTFPDTNSNVSTNNFCITANGTHNDVEVVLSPISVARPGFDAHYKLVYKNKGNQTLSGNLALTFDDAGTDFVAANPVVSQTANVLQWSYNNLLPFETRVIQLTLHLNSPLDTPALNSGDILDFAASITPVINDDLPADNVFVLHQIVVNSMDPNDIQCLEGSTVLPTEIGKYLHYAVQFENTGTDAAENIVVKDVIDTTKYDMDSLQLLDASAPVYARITGNVVEFIFKNIQLSPATGNPPVGGHGDILFKIKSKNTLVTGNMVEKQAKIYFDYNAPINTNIAQTTFAELSNTVFTKDNSITVSPNPTHAIITINGNSAIKSITLFDVQGRILETVLNSNSIDLADKTNGIYFLKITSEKGSKVEKVVKE